MRRTVPLPLPKCIQSKPKPILNRLGSIQVLSFGSLSFSMLESRAREAFTMFRVQHDRDRIICWLAGNPFHRHRKSFFCVHFFAFYFGTPNDIDSDRRAIERGRKKETTNSREREREILANEMQFTVNRALFGINNKNKRAPRAHTDRGAHRPWTVAPCQVVNVR